MSAVDVLGDTVVVRWALICIVSWDVFVHTKQWVEVLPHQGYVSLAEANLPRFHRTFVLGQHRQQRQEVPSQRGRGWS